MSTTYASDWPKDVELAKATESARADLPPAAEKASSEPEDRPRDLHRVSVDDRSSLFGSAAAAIGFSWIAYERLLGFSGIVGFVLFTWVVFLAFYSGVTLLGNPVPILWDRLASAVVTSASALVFGVVFWVILYVFIKAWPALHHLNFYTHDMAGVRPTAPLSQGGIQHAIVGSGIEIGLAIAMSLPLGIGTAVYLAEVGGRFAQIVRTIVEAMTALPDILAGLFVYTFLIIGPLHWVKSGLAVSIALAVTMIPIMARSAEVVLRVVPDGLREASWALGATRIRTVWNVVLPTARAGLMTSIILGTARIAGETAPLIIVTTPSTYFNKNPTQNGMNSLPLFIWTGVRSGEPRYIDRAWGAAAVLLFLVIALFAFARFVARDKVHSR